MLMVKNGYVVPCESDDPLRVLRGDVEIVDGRIAAIHPNGFEGSWEGDVIDAAECAVLPGFVNGHAHLRPMRALGEGMDVLTWHDKFVDGTSLRMNDQDAYNGAANAFLEMLKNGITTVQGMSILDHGELRAAVDVGIRARIVRHAERQVDLESTIEVARAQGGSEDDRVRLWLGLELPDMFDAKQLAWVAEQADELDLRIHTHFSEYKEDDVSQLANAGLLKPTISLAHCVHVAEDDSERFAGADVAVIHNPKSNLRFGNGVAPVARYLAQGIRVGLGTDGPLSTYSCDILEEARVATLLARGVARDPGAIKIGDAIHLATLGGASALGLDSQVGSLSVGKKGDVVVINLDAPKFRPLFSDGQVPNLVSLLVFTANGSNVRDVIVDGNVVVRDGVVETVDEGEIKLGCQESANRILADILGGE